MGLTVNLPASGVLATPLSAAGFFVVQVKFLIFIGSGNQADSYKIPQLRKAADVVRNPKATFRSPSSDRTFSSKSLTTHRTLQHICKAHKTHRTEANLAKELQSPTHGKLPYTLTADHDVLYLQQ